MAKTTPKPQPVLPAPAPESKRGLFELINEDYRIIEEEIDRLQAEGLDYPTAVEKATAIADNLTKDKVLRYAALTLNVEAMAEGYQKNALRLAQRQNRLTAFAERLRRRLAELLPEDFQAKDDYVGVKIGFTPLKVNDSAVLSVKDLPAEFVRVIPESYEVKKTEVKEHLKKFFEDLAKLPETEKKAAIEAEYKRLQGITLERSKTVTIR